MFKALFTILILLLSLNLQALDCDKATARVDQVICHNPSLLADEKRLDQLLIELGESADLARSQAEWLQERDRICSLVKDIAGCIRASTSTRVLKLQTSLEESSLKSEKL
jgi:uncharacterized protein